MRILDSHIERYANEAFEGYKVEHGIEAVGPFELACPVSERSSYADFLNRFWIPIDGTYVGAIISRYIKGFIAGIDRHPALGLHLIDPFVILSRPVEKYIPEEFCRYVFRRSIYLRQHALGVPRSLLNSRIIKRRTTDFVLSNRMDSLIKAAFNNPAEQLEAFKP